VEYRRRGLPWYFFPALLVILAAASWFIVKGVQARRQSSDPAGSPILVKARESVTPTPSAATAPGAEAPMPTVAASTTPPTPSGTVSAETRPASTAGSATAPQPVPEPPAEPPKPAFKLQGIFFRTANPSAIVNGRSVWVGSQVDGATVKAINRDNLTIEANGRTTVLTLD
jgi:cytoskeletal protein RodZ